MWSVISRYIDFRGKSVTDLGYGGGDFLWRSLIAGAHTVLGVDKNHSVYVDRYMTQHTKHGTKEIGKISTVYGDLNNMNSEWGADIGICCSVLPYLDEPKNFIHWMADWFKVSVIECQYKRDGPGFEFIKDADDMKYWLKDAFNSVALIGSSYAVSKAVYRDIWMCENDV